MLMSDKIRFFCTKFRFACEKVAKTDSKVVTLLKVIMVMPATNTLSERSFITLYRIKTYLWSTMSQERLNHYAT